MVFYGMRANKKGIGNGLALFALGNERENKALLVAEKGWAVRVAVFISEMGLVIFFVFSNLSLLALHIQRNNVTKILINILSIVGIRKFVEL